MTISHTDSTLKCAAPSFAELTDPRQPEVVEMPSRVLHSEQVVGSLGAPWISWQPLTTLNHDAQSLVVILGLSGRLHAFAIGLDSQIAHAEQAHAGFQAPWTGWKPLSESGDYAKSLVVASNRDGRLHAFRIGLDDEAGHNEQVAIGLNVPWTGWRPMSPTQNDAKVLVVAADQDKQLHALRIGLDGHVGRNEQLASGPNAPWSGWRPMTSPGDSATNLLVAANQDDRLHAFLIG